MRCKALDESGGLCQRIWLIVSDLNRERPLWGDTVMLPPRRVKLEVVTHLASEMHKLGSTRNSFSFVQNDTQMRNGKAQDICNVDEFANGKAKLSRTPPMIPIVNCFFTLIS